MSEQEKRTMNDPGEQLRAARERVGLSLQEISEQTLIPIARLQSLENHEFDRVGGVAYVTGYTKAYARVVGLDSGPLIASFESILGVEKLSLEPELTAGPIRSKTYIGKIIVIVFLAALAALIWFAVSWLWHGGAPSSVPNTFESSASDSVVVASEAPKSNPRTSLSSEDEASRSATSKAVLSRRMLEFASAAQSSVSNEAVTSSEEVLPTEASSLVASTPSSPDLLGPSESSVTNLSSAESSSSSSSIESDSLILSFRGECWVKVTDIHGTVKIAQIAQSGDNLQLFGSAPFEIVLGNARVADVLFNGDLVTIPLRAGRNKSQFTVGQ